MIEEEYIKFETAKLAKEKGFDIRSIFNYYNCPSFFEMQYGSGKYHDDELGEELIEEKNEWLLSIRPSRPISDSFPASTQSLLQKWLREKHNIHIGISVNQFGYGFMYSLIDLTNCTCIKHLTGGVNDKFTFEEALESGLIEGLKLIK